MFQKHGFIIVTSLVIALAATAPIVGQSSRQVNLMLSTMPAGKDPQRYPGYVGPKYKEFEQRSLYLTMRDGVKIAIDAVWPKDLPAGEKIPAVMNMTRYWRAQEGQVPIRKGGRRGKLLRRQHRAVARRQHEPSRQGGHPAPF